MGSKKQCMRCMEFYDQRFDICPYCGYEENSERKELLHIDAGTVLADRYLVGNALGFGGFGVTYIGYDRKLKRKVAIKEYLPSEFATRALHQPEVMVNSSEKKMQQFAAGMNKFLDEAKKLATLSSLDGIVHIYDSFEANHTAYIVMEYLEGETLTAFMKREKKIPEEQAVDIVVPILQTLEDVHRHGIIHRDIAPDNIFLAKGQDGKTHVKLIDFGASRYASTSHSKSLTVLIKPGYSPAEQYQSNGEQGPFTDVYAVGAVLYQLVTGVRPEDAFERRTQMQSGGKDPLKDPSCYNGDLSESFENALMNAMSVRVEDRSETAEIFLRELTSQEPVKRRVSSIRRIDFMRWPLWAKIGVPTSAVAVITLIVLLAAGVIGFKGAVGIYKLPEGMTRVPDMINASMDDAQTWLDEAGLQERSTPRDLLKMWYLLRIYPQAAW
jgi:serine/threonine protein kinase